MEKALEKILKGLKVEQDCILSPVGDVTLVYSLQLREQFTSSDEDLESLHQAFIKAIKVLPQNAVYHQQDWFTESACHADYSKPLSFLSHSSERFFNERPCLEHTSFVFLTLRASSKKIISASSGLLRRHIVPGNVLSEQVLNDFFNACG